MKKNKIKIGENGKVVIKWRVLPMNYNHETENDIILKFAKKYGISKDNIRIEPEFISPDGDISSFDNITNNIEDVQNPEFQRELFKQWLEINGTKDYDFDKIIEIDNQINDKIDFEIFEKHKRYTLKYLRWKNFMSYGEDNFFDFTNLKNLVLLTSEPANQGGKTTFCLDLFRFLLFGKVTSRENDWTLSKVFNSFIPEATECVVEGCIEIDGEDYVIKRTITRPALKKRTERSKTPQTINYYRLVNGEYIELCDEEEKNIDQQEEQSGRETNKVIKEAIGNTEDFDLMICVDADNLKSLISLKDADRGRLISRWVGLLPLEKKDEIARETYNKQILPNMLLTRFNKDELLEQIEALNTLNETSEDNIKKATVKKDESEKKIQQLEQQRDTLLSSKQPIDENLSKIDIVTLDKKIETLKNDGIQKKNEISMLTERLESYGDIKYDENHYQDVIEQDKQKNIELNQAISDFKRINTLIDSLKKSEYCPTCGARLKDVDNSEKIKEAEANLGGLKLLGTNLRNEVNALAKEKEELSQKRRLINEKNQIELKISACQVQVSQLREQFIENTNLRKNIEANKAAIEQNNKITTSLNIVDENIKIERQIINENLRSISVNSGTIDVNNKNIKHLTDTVNKIIEEEKIKRHWEIYKEMIGKKGISKLILRNVLPIINGELKRLLGDVCDFDVEVIIDDSNDVAFNIIKDGVIKNLGSGSGFEKTVASLALRSVLSKISTFSKPSFVVFDEVLGGVSEGNYDNVKVLYDKIVKDYQCILFITHNSVFKEWADTVITIKKEGNISKILA